MAGSISTWPMASIPSADSSGEARQATTARPSEFLGFLSAGRHFTCLRPQDVRSARLTPGAQTRRARADEGTRVQTATCSRRPRRARAHPARSARRRQGLHDQSGIPTHRPTPADSRKHDVTTAVTGPSLAVAAAGAHCAALGLRRRRLETDPEASKFDPLRPLSAAALWPGPVRSHVSERGTRESPDRLTERLEQGRPGRDGVVGPPGTADEPGATPTSARPVAALRDQDGDDNR
jgi:hypothetical protein